eukprot:13590993-Alexandrium_andersonii.AAC.1
MSASGADQQVLPVPAQVLAQMALPPTQQLAAPAGVDRPLLWAGPHEDGGVALPKSGIWRRG